MRILGMLALLLFAVPAYADTFQGSISWTITSLTFVPDGSQFGVDGFSVGTLVEGGFYQYESPTMDYDSTTDPHEPYALFVAYIPIPPEIWGGGFWFDEFLGPASLVVTDGNVFLAGTSEGPMISGVGFYNGGTDTDISFITQFFDEGEVSVTGRVTVGSPVNLSATPVPESDSLLLLGLGLFGFCAIRRRLIPYFFAPR